MDSTQDPLVHRALSLLNTGQLRQATAELQSMCTVQNTNPEHWFLLGVALSSAGKPAAAEQAFKRALALNPGHTRARAIIGRSLLDSGKYDEAVAHLQLALVENPGNRSVRIGLIYALTRLKHFAEAESVCTSHDQGEPDDVEMITSLGIIRMNQGRLKEAIGLFDQVLSMQPAFLKALVNKGLALKSAGRLEAAIDQFRQAVTLVPGSVAAWEQLGLAHLKRGSIDQATPCMEKAFQLNPGNIKAGRQLASVYRHMRRPEAAAAVYRRILEVHPEDVQARFFLDAYRAQEDGRQPERIPADYVQSLYGGRNAGRALDTSLTGSLEYRAPLVLNEAVREVCDVPEAGLDILEVGCGTGLCGSQLADIAHSLVGTDLSADLLAVAGEKHAYDKLFVADLVDVLSDNADSFDLVIAMDVLCFFGDLTDIFRKCYCTLRRAGVFAFSVGKPETAEPWELHPYGHFVHSYAYLQAVAKETGFEEIFAREITLRREMNEDRPGYVCLFRRD